MKRTLISVVIPLSLVGGLGAFVWSERDQLQPLLDAPISELLAISLLVTVAHFLNSTEFWLLYRLQGVRSGILENWMLFFAGNLANYLPAQIGAVYRVRYMRSVHSVSYAASAAVYGANLIATLLGAAIAGLTGAIILGATDHFNWVVVLGYGSLLVLAAAILAIPLPSLLKRSGRLARAWRSFQDGFDQTRRSPRRSAEVALMEAGKYFVTAIRFQIAFGLLGINEPFWFFLALAPAAGLAQFVSFTPGAIGFREAFLTATAVALGSPLSTGLLAATADRAVMLATSICLGGLGFAMTYPTLRRAELAAPSDEPVGAPSSSD